MKLNKILMSLFMSFVLTISLIVPSASAENSQAKEIEVKYTKFELNYGGKPINSGDSVVYEDKKELELFFSWEIDDAVVVNEGDYTRMELPIAFLELQKSGSLKSGEDVVANWEIIGEEGARYIEWTYTDYFKKNYENKQGQLGIKVNFDLSEFEDDSRQEIPYGDEGNEFEVAIKPKGDLATDITKYGKPNQAINADAIEWTIYANSKLENLKNGYVLDKLPEGLEDLDLDSVRVYEAKVGLNLDEHPEILEEVTDAFKANNQITLDEDGNLRVDLGNTSRAYIITLTSKIKPDTEVGTRYLNRAEIYTEDKMHSHSEADYTTIANEKLVTKEGYYHTDKDADYITWTIDINKAQSNLGMVTVNDTMTETIKNNPAFLGIESMLIEELITDGNEWTTKPAEGITQPSKFPFDLDVGEKTYRLTVKTKINFNVEDYRDVYNFLNKVELIKDGKKLSEDEATVQVTRKGIFKKTGEEGNPGFGDPFIKWELDVNKAKHALKEVIVTDTIASDAGHELKPETIKIYKMVDGKRVDVTKTYTIYDVNNLGFSIKLGDIEDNYIVTYETKITDLYDKDGNKITYNNTGSMSGDGIGDLEDEEVKVPPIYSNEYSKSNVKDGVDYKERTMSWNMTISANKEEITSLTITDTFRTPNSMLFLKDTLVVMKGEDKLVEGTDYKLVLDDSAVGFKILFGKGAGLTEDKPMDRARYVITFETSFDPDVIKEYLVSRYPGESDKHNVVIPKDGIYHNDATFEYITPGTEGVIKDNNNNYKLKDEFARNGRKSGIIDPSTRKITWTVDLNLLQQDFTGETYKISDKMIFKKDGTDIKGHDYIKESLKAYETTIKTNGAIVQAETPLVLGEDYEIIETDEGFDLQFINAVTTSYRLVYESQATGISQPLYGNTTSHKVGDIPFNYTASVPYYDWESYVDKTSDITGGVVFIEDEIQWTVTLNTALSNIPEPRMIDEISKGHVYLNDSLKVELANADGEFEPFTEFKLNVTDNEATGGQTLEVLLGKDNKEFKLDTILRVKYSTIVIEEGIKISNAATLLGKEKLSGNTDDKKFSVISGSEGSASGDRPLRDYQVTKVTEVDGVETIVTDNGAKFVLTYDLNGSPRIVHDKVYETDSSGIIKFLSLPLGRDYTLYEVEAPVGFEFDETAAEDIALFEGEMLRGIKRDTFKLERRAEGEEEYVQKSVSNERTLIDVDVKKVWIDGPIDEDRPVITLQLVDENFPDVILREVKLESGKNTEVTYVFEDLPKTDVQGNEIKYKVIELPVEWYNSEVSEDGLTVTNTFESKKKDVTATKKWVNGPESKPVIILQLQRNGIDHLDPVEITSGNAWSASYTWKDLDIKDKNGIDYVYTVVEVSDFEDYVVDENGLEVTNTYVSPKTDKTVTKVWSDGDSLDRSVITVRLLRNGEQYLEPITLGDKGDNWSYTWKDLDERDSNGVLYIYEVEEITELENYETSYDQDTLTITNQYIIPLMDITGTKVWEGGPTVKPTIELQLYRDGEAFGEPVELKSGVETYTWKDLDKTDIQGVEHVYTVKEVGTPEDFVKTEDGLTVTNTYVSPKTEKTVTKFWVDGDATVRPTIIVQLYRNGEAYLDPVEINGEGNEWSYTWADLDLNDSNAVEYKYSVEEISEFSDYGVSYSDDTFTITNKYMSPITDIVGHKVWVNGGTVKPTVTLQLMRNGEAYLDPVELAHGEFDYVWSDLDVTDIDGVPYEYTIIELDVPEDYEASYDGMTVTNTYISPLTEFTVQKQWVNTTGKHPDIKVQLYKDGVAFGEPVILKDGTTSYTWEGLDLTDENAVEHVYTVDELDVPLGYVKVVHGNIIVNTFDRNLLPLTGSPSVAGLATASLALGVFLALIARRKREEA